MRGESLRRILGENGLEEIADEMEEVLKKLVEQHRPVKAIIAGSLAKKKIRKDLLDC